MIVLRGGLIQVSPHRRPRYQTHRPPLTLGSLECRLHLMSVHTTSLLFLTNVHMAEWTQIHTAMLQNLIESVELIIANGKPNPGCSVSTYRCLHWLGVCIHLAIWVPMSNKTLQMWKDWHLIVEFWKLTEICLLLISVSIILAFYTLPFPYAVKWKRRVLYFMIKYSVCGTGDIFSSELLRFLSPLLWRAPVQWFNRSWVFA